MTQIEELNDLGIFVQQVPLLSITCAFRGDFRLKNLASKTCSFWRVSYRKQHTLEIVLSVLCYSPNNNHLLSLAIHFFHFHTPRICHKNQEIINNRNK